MAGVSAAPEKFNLGGLPQGDPLSPVLYVMIADFILDFAATAPSEGYRLDEETELKQTGYADDCLACSQFYEDACITTQDMVTAMGFMNIRVQGKKCIYLRNQTAVRNDDDVNFWKLEGIIIKESEDMPEETVPARNKAGGMYTLSDGRRLSHTDTFALVINHAVRGQ